METLKDTPSATLATFSDAAVTLASGKRFVCLNPYSKVIGLTRIILPGFLCLGARLGIGTFNGRFFRGHAICSLSFVLRLYRPSFCKAF